MVMGTAHYIAPEQALGHDAEPASDVYSLAVCGYECLAGHRPFLSEHAVSVAMMHIRDIAPPLPPDVPPGIRAVIEATLVKDPRQRYANGGEFANAVAAVRAGHPLPPPSGLAAAGYLTHPVPPNAPPPQSAPMVTVPPAPGSGPVGPGSRPSMSPVPPPMTMGQPRRRAPAWTLLAVASVLLLIVVVLVLAFTVWSDDSENPPRVPVGTTDWPHTGMESSDGGSGQGMMSTLPMENHR